MIDRRRRLVDMLLAVEHGPHLVLLNLAQRPRLRSALGRRPRREWTLTVAPVVAGLRTARCLTCLAGAHQRSQLGDRVIDHRVGSLPLVGLSVAS